MSKLQEKPSALKREHPTLQKSKFIIFFLCLWVILPSWIHPDCESGYGSTNPIESGPNPDTDPDPQHCLRVYAKPIIWPHKRRTYLGASLGFRGEVPVHPGSHLKVQHAGLRVTYPG